MKKLESCWRQHHVTLRCTPMATRSSDLENCGKTAAGKAKGFYRLTLAACISGSCFRGQRICLRSNLPVLAMQLESYLTGKRYLMKLHLHAKGGTGKGWGIVPAQREAILTERDVQARASKQVKCQASNSRAQRAGCSRRCLL